MQARGPLMVEHRLIERMIGIINRALARIERIQEIDPLFVDATVDFIQIYADRTHHGKEEDIMFRSLKDKDMSAIDRLVMKGLIEEHVFGRSATKALVDANTKYRNGDTSALREVSSHLRTFVNFYPKHIEKEDKVFFPAARAYLSDEEDQAMLTEFMDFDRKMIHEKYKLVVQSLEGNDVAVRFKEHMLKR